MVQAWLGNNLSPEQWGWARNKDNLLVPVQTKDPAAPDEILKLIFCRCTDCSNARCGCRKASMLCSAICHNCNGSCTNSTPIESNDDHDSDEDVEVEASVPSSDHWSVDEDEGEQIADEEQPGPSRPKRQRRVRS